MAKKRFGAISPITRIAPELHEVRKKMQKEMNYGSLTDVDRLIAKMINNNKKVEIKEIKF